MKYNEALRIMKRIYSPKNGESVMLLSPPGVGKTALLLQLAREMKWTAILRHPVYEEVIDSRGIPYRLVSPDGIETMAWLPPSDIPLEVLKNTQGETLWILDDLPQALGQVQNGYARCFYSEERLLGGWKLDNRVHVAATGNRMEDRAAVTEMPSFAKARITFINLEPSAGDWCDWAMSNNDVSEEFISFLTPGGNGVKPGLGLKHLYDFDPARPMGQGNCSPRTLHIASKHFLALQGEQETLVDEVLSGILCPAFALEFRAHLKMYKSMPDISAILEGKEYDRAFIKRPDLLHLVIVSLIKRAEAKHKDALAAFVTGLPDDRVDYAALMYLQVAKKFSDFGFNRNVIKWALAHKDALC